MDGRDGGDQTRPAESLSKPEPSDMQQKKVYEEKKARGARASRTGTYQYVTVTVTHVRSPAYVDVAHGLILATMCFRICHLCKLLSPVHVSSATPSYCPAPSMCETIKWRVPCIFITVCPSYPTRCRR